MECSWAPDLLTITEFHFQTQVEEFKKELEASNLKIHEITRSLDSAKVTLTEQEYNLNLALKNAKFFENQLQSKRDSVTKARLQQESAVSFFL